MSNRNLTDEELYQLATKRLALKKAFFIHLVVYIAVMLLLIVINLSFSSTLWFIYPLLGWGIGVAIHGFTTYSKISSSSQHKIQKEIQKIKNEL